MIASRDTACIGKHLGTGCSPHAQMGCQRLNLADYGRDAECAHPWTHAGGYFDGDGKGCELICTHRSGVWKMGSVRWTSKTNLGLAHTDSRADVDGCTRCTSASRLQVALPPPPSSPSRVLVTTKTLDRQNHTPMALHVIWSRL